jgi:hypothetical protein
MQGQISITQYNRSLGIVSVTAEPFPLYLHVNNHLWPCMHLRTVTMPVQCTYVALIVWTKEHFTM